MWAVPSGPLTRCVMSLLRSQRQDTELVSSLCGGRVVTHSLLLALHSPLLARLLETGAGTHGLTLPFTVQVIESLVKMIQGQEDNQQDEVREAAVLLSMSLQENKKTEEIWEDVLSETFSGSNSEYERDQEQIKNAKNLQFTTLKIEGIPVGARIQAFDKIEEENNDNNGDKMDVKSESNKRPTNELKNSDSDFFNEYDNEPDFSDELQADDRNFRMSARDRNPLVRKGSRASKTLEFNFPCDDCRVVLQTKNGLKRHQLRKHGIILPCEKCDETFKDKKYFKKHMKTNHLSHICTICGEKKFDKYNMDKHMEAKHSEGVTCPHCGLHLSAQLHLNQHIKRFHEDNEIKKCTKCDYKNSVQNEINQHYKRRHTDEQKETCEFCGEVFKGLKKHLTRTGCGGQKIAKNTPCSQCSKTFSSILEVRTHIKRIHGNVKNRLCPHCSYKSYSGFNLKLHVSKMHFGTGLIKEPCPHCNKETFNLKYHIETYHNTLI